MTAPNGRANGSAIDNPTELVAQAIVGPAVMRPSTGPQFSTDQIRQLIAELEVPFDPAVIEWRVTNTTNRESIGDREFAMRTRGPIRIGSIPY